MTVHARAAARPTLVANPPLAPSDVAQMSVLGAVWHDDASFEEICATARRIAEQDWQPVPDVLEGGLLQGLDAGWLVSTPANEIGDHVRFRLTERGRARLRALLARDLPPRGSLRRTCVALKTCLLFAADEQTRAALSDELCGSCPSCGRAAGHV